MTMPPRARKALKLALVGLRVLGIYAGVKAAREREAREKQLLQAVRTVDLKLDALARAGGVRFGARKSRLSDESLRQAASRPGFSAPDGPPPGPPSPPRNPADRPVG